MKSTLLSLLFSSIALLAFASGASAAPSLTLDPCSPDDGCEGSTLFASVEDQGGGVWRVTYTIDTDGYTGDHTGFNQIGLKVIQGWSSASLFSAPNGVANWSTVLEAPISANSLCGNTDGNSDKLCIYAQNSLVDISGGGEFTWVFDVVGGTIAEEWHLGAQYASAVGPARGKIISAEGVPSDGPPVPEPTAALLFGVGAVLVSRRVRTRR